MSINLRAEHAIALTEVPNRIPKRRGKKVHYSTVFRWTSRGARGRLLESFMIGGVRYTTVEALARFLSVTPVASSESLDDLSDAIDAALKEAGL